MEKIINLRAATAADDLRCLDGELEGGDIFFSDGESTGGSPVTPSSFSLELTAPQPVPDGMLWLAVHRFPDEREAVPVFINPGELPAPPEPAAVAAWPPRLVCTGKWLALLPAGGAGERRIIYGMRSGGAFRWLGACPSPPAVAFSAAPKALPPYSYADGDLPRLTVSVAPGADVGAALTAAGERFLAAVRAAGLNIGRVRAAACRRLSDGSLWQLGAPQWVGTGELSFRIVSTESSGGLIVVTAEASQAPFMVAMNSEGDTLPGSWAGISDGLEFFVREAGADFPAVPEALSEARDIFGVSGRLVAVRGAEGALSVEAGCDCYPFVSASPSPSDATLHEGAFSGHGLISGGNILFLAPSQASVASSQALLPPLFAFCTDGIRLLAPYGGGYRDVRLLSRHAALGRDGFATLPDGVAFLSEAGVMKVSGTSVSRLHGAPAEAGELTDADRLMYLYGDDALVLFRPGVGAWLLKGGSWHSLGGMVPEEALYAWPSVWLRSAGSVGAASLSALGASPEGRYDAPAERAAVVPFVTRPVKLTDAFAVKRLIELRALWPDGSRHSFHVYGSMDLAHWHSLGASPGGHMRARGSGWRFFKIESVAISAPSGYLLPQFFIKFAL